MKSVLTCSIVYLLTINASYASACSPEQAREKAWQLAETANLLGGQELAQIERFAQALASVRAQTPPQDWKSSCQVYDARLAEFEVAKQQLNL